ncbi:hypothetical protein GCM10010193_12300 [Kitasatospora atroaurantiaca]
MTVNAPPVSSADAFTVYKPFSTQNDLPSPCLSATVFSAMGKHLLSLLALSFQRPALDHPPQPPTRPVPP